VNLLDAVIGVLLVTAAVGGYRLGFVARAVSWLLTAVGLYVAARVLPNVVERADEPSGRNDLLLVAAAMLVAGAFLGQVIGLVLGNRLNLAIRSAKARRADAVAGAAAGVVGVMVAVWLLVPAMAVVPGSAARLASSSTIAQTLDRSFPEAPDTTRSLRQLLGDDYPRVFERIRPAPDLGSPPAASGLDTGTAEAVEASTVKVTGEACGRIQEGSGVVVGAELVVTNAHVVAGEERTTLERDDGRTVDARLVAFDPDRDLAVLSVPDIDRPALPLGDPEVGMTGAVFGHPGGGPLELSPFEIGRIEPVTGTDIYDQQRSQRDVLFLASALRPGDSGGALVVPSGQVVGIAFAIAPDRDGVAYALAVSEVRAVLADVDMAGANAGNCTG
jgi:S1-C subfamily serine protease